MPTSLHLSIPISNKPKPVTFFFFDIPPRQQTTVQKQNIIILMLVLQGIRVKFQKSIIPVKIRSISVGYNQSYSSNQKKYTQTGTHAFQWNETITLPLYYNVPLQFNCKCDENYENPEDPNVLLTSTIKIIDYKQTTAEGSLVNKLKNKVATIYIAFKILNQKLIIPEEQGRLVISSILAHFDNHYGNKGLMEISMGYKNLFTPTVNVIAGQLLWGEQMSLPVEENNPTKGTKDQIVMKIIVDEKIIGEAKISLQSIKNLQLKYKKFKISDVNDPAKKIGILFLDISYKDKQGKEKTTQIPNQYSLSLKKATSYRNKKSVSQKILNNINIFAYKDQQEQSSNRSQRMLPSLISESKSKPDLLKVQSNFDKLDKRKQLKKNGDLFSNVFNLGDIQKSDNIRQIFRQRRHKKVTNGSSLPKLK